MERHIFVLLVAVCVGPLAVASTTTRHSRDTDDDLQTDASRPASGAPTLPRVHDGNRRRPVPDTEGAPSLGRVSIRGQQPKHEEKAAGVTCSQRKKCSVGNNTDALNFYARNCFCDDLCHTYGDCCKDAMRPARRPHKLARKTFACQRVREVDPEVEMYVVTSCPRQFKDVWVREQCGRETTSNDLFYRVPVSGVQSTLVYRNYYCALCNGDTNVTFWQVTLSCGDGPDPASNKGDAAMDPSAVLRQLLETRAAECGVEFAHPTMRARKCKSHVSRCDRKWTGKKVMQKCKTGHTAYVYLGLTVYRNKHCATCNFVNASQLTCVDPRTPQCEFDCSVALAAAPPAFSVLLDINGGTGRVADNRVGVAGHETYTKTVIDVRRCPDNNVYDPFSAVCRQIYCGPGRVFVDGDCQPDDTIVSPTSPSSSTTITTTTKRPTNVTITTKSAAVVEQGSDDVNSNEMNAVNAVTSIGNLVTHLPPNVAPRLMCPLLRLNASEYVMLDNSSVLLTAAGLVYTPRQYRVDDGVLFVCSPYLNQTYEEPRNVTHTVAMFKFGRLQRLVSIIGLLISITALAIHFIVYMMLPPLRNIPGKCLLCLVASLFIAQLLFLAGSARTEIPELCLSIGVVMHYAFLAAFFWMNVMAVDICRTFSSSRVVLPADDRSSRFIFYSLYAWLTPAVIVGGSLALDLVDVPLAADYRPHYGDGLCWITRRWPLLVLFALPLALLLVVNTILFVVTVKNLCIISKDAKRARGTERSQFLLYVKLSTIMGLTWLFGFVASLADFPVLWYVFVVFNTLQGAFICFAFICTKKVFRLLHERGRTHRATIGSGHNGRYYSSSSSGKSGLTRPTYLSEGEALVISQETSI